MADKSATDVTGQTYDLSTGESNGWLHPEKVVTLWECGKCGFQFDATHTDNDGGYSCPVCDPMGPSAHLGRIPRL